MDLLPAGHSDHLQQPGCTVQPLEQRTVRQHLSNTDTSFLTQPISAVSTSPLPCSSSVGWPYSAWHSSTSDVLVRWLHQDRTTLFLLSLRFSGTQPWLRILTYFLHTQIHGRSPLSPAETKSPLKSSSVLPGGLGPLTHHIPGVHLKNARDLHTDTITGETKNNQASGHRRLQSAQVNPNMSAVIYLYFPASPRGKNNLTDVDTIC